MASTRTRTRLDPEVELSDEWRRIAIAESVPEDEIGPTFREFVNYWTDLPDGPKARKLLWTKTWQNQCIRTARQLKPKLGGQRYGRHPQARSASGFAG